MNELKVVIEQKNGVISFENFDELKEQLSRYLEQYRGATFTEESRVFAKTVVSELRKLKKAVNDRKIEVKKAFMQPYEEFDDKTKELMALIEEPIGLIDGQVKAFEKKRIDERKQLIRQIYEEKAGELEEYAPLSRIYSDKWENASTSRKKIEEEMDHALAGIRMDIQSLNLMRVEADVTAYALEKYRSGDTAVESMRKAGEFAELMDRRRKAEEEAEKKRLEEEAAKPAPVPEADKRAAVEAIWGVVPEAEPFTASHEEDQDTQQAVYRICAVNNEIWDLETYMDSVGIAYERIG